MCVYLVDNGEALKDLISRVTWLPLYFREVFVCITEHDFEEDKVGQRETS